MIGYLKENKGITLIALVITIIVLLILATISIPLLKGNNGVINQAGNAKNLYNISEEKEILEIATIQSMGKSKSGSVEEKYLKDALDGKADVEIIRKKFVVTFGSGRSYYVDAEGNTQEYTKIDVSTLPIMSNSKFINDMSSDKENILSVEFLDTVNPPVQCYKIFNVSKSGDETIKAWLIENKDNAGKYDLYIGGNNGVRIDSCDSTFKNYTNCTKIDVGNLYTDGVTSMAWMFGYCNNLIDLDVSNFNTSSVTSIKGMFYNCSKIDSLDINDWDVSNIKGSIRWTI